MDPWTKAMLVLGAGILLAVAIGILYARAADLHQFRRWAHEDGLSLTDRAALRAHYRARQLR